MVTWPFSGWLSDLQRSGMKVGHGLNHLVDAVFSLQVQNSWSILARKARPKLSRSCVWLLPADGTVRPGNFVFHVFSVGWTVQVCKIQMFWMLDSWNPRIFLNFYHFHELFWQNIQNGYMTLPLAASFFHPNLFLAWCKAHAVQVEIRGQ